jgi:hypothetical protein
MTQSLDALPTNSSQRLLCSYVNPTPSIQVARITNVPNWYFERVIFPDECLLFESLPDAIVEIYTSANVRTVPAHQLVCDRA